jgi:hypothetical protein
MDIVAAMAAESEATVVECEVVAADADANSPANRWGRSPSCQRRLKACATGGDFLKSYFSLSKRLALRS